MVNGRRPFIGGILPEILVWAHGTRLTAKD